MNDLIQMDYVVLTEDLTFGKHRYILNALDVLRCDGSSDAGAGEV